MYNQPKYAPQFEQRLFFNAKQQSIPNGKHTMAHSIPRAVKSSSKTPTRHAGQAPTAIIDGLITMFVVVAGCVAPYVGINPTGVTF